MSAKPGTKVSLHRIIGNVVGNLGITNVNQDLDNFARWAFDAELKIGTKNSTKHYECEEVVKDRRICLPENFIKLNALKYGGEIIDVTFRDFRMFDKAAKAGATLGDSKFVSGNLQITNPGAIQVMRIAFSGTFIAADTVTVTVVMNNCGTVVLHTFTYVVQLGDTLADIATALAGDINAIPSLGFTAVASGVNLDITGANVGISFTVTTFAGSSLGVITVTTLQAHVPPTKSCGCITSCSCGPVIKTTSNNLANTQAAEINTGASRESYIGNQFGFYGTGNAKVYTIDNGYIYVNFMVNGRIGISYEGIWVDDNGWPLVEQSHETAITAYCEWMYLRRQMINGKISQGIAKDVENRWYWLCGQVRGDDEMPNSREMIHLSSIWNAMLPSKSLQFF